MMQADVSHQHDSVMLREAVEALVTHEQGFYVDGTFGRGGHSQGILQKLQPAGRLLALDQDPQAIAFGQVLQQKDPRLTLIHSNFAQLQSVVETLGMLGQVDGVLLDLGVSSPQLDNDERGFSFMRSGPLDMRMDTTQGPTALEFLQQITQEDLAVVLKEYGEERHAKRLAKVIKEAVAQNAMVTTLDLANVVAKTLGYSEKKHPATRTFQALRIALNREMQVLDAVLAQALAVLKPGGRLVVISFHSLEDRRVKHFMKPPFVEDPRLARLPVAPEVPLKPFSRVEKAIFPTDDEIRANPRSRSAVMRVAHK